MSTVSDDAGGNGANRFVRQMAAIMIRPRRTVRSILSFDQSRSLGLIMILAILSALIHDADLQGLDELHSLGDAATLGVVVIAIMAGVAFMSVVLYFVLPWSAWAAGRYFGGVGTIRDLRVALIWSLAPFVWALFFRIPSLVLSIAGGDAGPPRFVVQQSRIELSGGTIGSLGFVLFAIFALLELTVFVWYLIVASRAIGEAHRFSSLGGFGVLILAMILPLATVALLVFAGWLYSQKMSG